MEIKARHTLGQTVYIVRETKAVPMQIRTILADDAGIWYSDTAAPHCYAAVPERECFASVPELVAYLTADTATNPKQ